MSEKFKAESPAVSPEQAEEAKFWDAEIAEWKKDYDTQDKKNREESIGGVLNNLNRWLPFEKPGSAVGGRRIVENDERGQQLMTDIDTYLEEHDLMETMRKVTDQEIAKTTAILAMFTSGKKEAKWETIIPEADMRKFYMNLYKAMREKGYTRAELAK